MIMKTCNKCATIKPVEQFSRNSSTKSGYQNYCKECSSKYFAEFVNKRKTETTKIYVESKKCVKCGTVKPRSQYTKRTNSKDGLNNYCKYCWRSYLKSRYTSRKKTAS